MSEIPDKNCYTLPDGSCVGINCMHDKVPPICKYPDNLCNTSTGYCGPCIEYMKRKE